jgi:amino acid transporter
VLQGPLHLPYGPLWAGFDVLVAVATAVLGYLGIGISARTGTALGVFEIVVLVALALWLIAQAGSRNQLAVFGTGYATVKGFTGTTGVVAGSVYAILAFIGFEASAPLAEEARDARRVVPVAVVASAFTIGVFYVLTTYAATVFFGPQRFASFAQFGGGSPWIELARQVWGIGWVVVFLAILNSTFANGNAGNNATTRTWYAMGRIGLLPRALARTHPVRRSPHVAVAAQLVWALALVFLVGVPFGPIAGFVFLATLVTAVVIAIYLTTNLACLVFYLRERRAEFNWLLHGVVPVLGIVAFVPALLTSLGVGGQVLSFVSPLPFPDNLVGPIVGVWTLLGLLYLVYLTARLPDRLRQTERVFAEPER